MANYNDIAKNSSKQPLSNVYYFDVYDGKFADETTELDEILERFKTRFKKGEIAYIKHKGEHGKSDHLHLICRNNTAKGFENVPQLRNDVLYSIAHVQTETAKVGDVVPSPPMRTSSLADWYGYVLHDEAYFKKKGLSFDKQFTYNHDDIKGDVSFIDEMKLLYDEIMTKEEYNELEIIYKGVEDGLDDWKIIKQLKYVNSTNLYSTFQGIKKVRQFFDDKAFDVKRAFDVLTEFTFQNSNIKDNLKDTLFMRKGERMHNEEIIEMLFVHFVEKLHNDDVIRILFGE